MSRYRMEDGSVIDTSLARATYEEDTYWDGHNHCSVVTRSQWAHQTLYCSRKGRYYVEHTSQFQGSTPHVEWVAREEAARWLLANNYELPEDLADLENQVME